MSVIFLAGVHGVGKGYHGAPVAAALEMLHFTASQLIREEKGYASWSKNKLVTDVDENQLALIKGLERHRETGKAIMLDGHFTLWNPAGEIILLAPSIFSSLNILGVVLMTDDAELIAARLVERDKVLTSPAAIAELAAEEASHAEHVCRLLDIPLIVIDAPTEGKLSNSILRLLDGC